MMSQQHHHRRGVPRAEAIGILTAVAFLAFMGWLAVQVVQLSGELRDANAGRDVLYQQVQRLGVPPAAGPRGDPGQSIVGPPGPEGRPGRDAPTPTPIPGPSGAPGPAGPPGQNATGTPGKDGKDGANGTSGADGAPGSAGQPPTSWTFTSGKDTYTCTRAPGFDPASPQYTCSTPSPSPSPSPPGPPFATTRRR